jgi:uridine kinase
MIGLPMPQLPAPAHKFDRIAFAGPMCVGKTTLALGLTTERYIKVSFADKLKSIAYDLYGFKTKDNESRKLLQELADDLKSWDSDLFVKHLLLEMHYYIKLGYTKLVVDDVRFKIEEEALHNNGFVVINVTCDEFVRRERIKKLYPDTDDSRLEHPSEHGWRYMRVDHVIDSTTEIAHYDIMRMIENGDKNSFNR